MAEFNAGSIEADTSLNLDGLIAGIQAAQAYAEAHPIEVPVKADTSALSAAIAPVAGGGGDGRGGGGAGILAGLGFGGGAGALGGIGGGIGGAALGAAGGLAAPFGSAGQLAGFGVERYAGTALGIAGSLGGGALGGGILAAGAGATAAVGAGTNLAGIGQAAGDVKQYSTALDALNKAIAVYGAGSTQAQHAQASLNYTVAGFPPVAQQAVIAAANQTTAFKAMFDQATGAAEKIGANIIQQTVLMAEGFLPTIGKYAAMNMGIIQQSLQPLFQWLQGPGLSIFGHFESMFTTNLPSAMHAFTQGIELLIRMLDFAASHTGGFMSTLDALITKWNSPPYTAKWEHAFNTLFGLFHTWFAFFKILAEDIYDIFKQAAGVGAGVAETLTGMLTHLHDYLNSRQGMTALHALFEAHKNQLIAILQILPPLVGAFGKLDLILAPTLTTAVTIIAKAFDDILKIPLLGPLAAYAIAFGLIGSRLAGSVNSMINFGKAIGGVVTWVSDLTKVLFGVDGALALSEIEIYLIIAAVAVLGIAAYEIIKHWGEVKKVFDDFTKFMHSSWGQFITWFLVITMPMIGLPLLMMEHWRGLATFFGAMWTTMKAEWNGAWSWFFQLGEKMRSVFDGALSWFENAGHDVIFGLWHGMLGIWNTVWGWITSAGSTIQHAYDAAINWLVKSGSDLFTGFWRGMTGFWSLVWGWITGLGSTIQSAFNGAVTWLLNSGHDVVQGIWNGITGTWHIVTDWFGSALNVAKSITDAIGDGALVLLNFGDSLVHGIWNGVVGAWDWFTGQLTQKIKDIPVIGALILKMGSPSRVMADEVGQWIPKGIAAGINEHWGSVDAALTGNLNKTYAAAGISAQGAGVGGAGVIGPAVHIDNVTFQDQTDMAAFMNMTDFLIQQRRTA